jgi:hypothetical protein
MLKVFQQSLESGKILYYWDKRYNLIEGLHESHKKNLAGRLKGVIADIEKTFPGNPVVIAKHICKFYVLKLHVVGIMNSQELRTPLETRGQ